MDNVGERFIYKAEQFWWKYQIAFEFNVTPKEVNEWDANEIMEALAAIGLKNKYTSKEANKTQ